MQVRNNRFLSDEEGNFGCPFCKTKFKLTDFNDGLSQREAGISGLCQGCQDKVFAESEDE